MNTPAHILLSLAALSGTRLSAQGAEKLPRAGLWISAGALLPDAPMFLFFFWQRAVLGEPGSVIWGDAYFRDSWQLFFNVFNSIPLALLGLGLSFWAARRGWALLFASVLIHCAIDLPLHHDDAHAHFLPFSDWRFASPVSYWDPRHFGQIGAGVEVIAVLVCSARLWRSSPARLSRLLLVAVSALSVSAYVGFYLMGLLPG